MTIEFEQQVVGGMLIDPSIAKQVEIDPDHFQSEQCRQIYKAISKNISDGRAFDVVTISDQLQNDTGDNYLPVCAEMARTGTVSVEVSKEKARVIKESAMKRRAMHILDSAMSDINSGDRDAVDRAISQLMALDNTESKHEYTMREAALAAVNNVEKAYERAKDGGSVGVPTGIADLDRIMGGFHPGDLIVVGARPSVGKTAFALNVAIGSQQKWGIVSTEQGHDQIGQRCIAISGGVSMHNMRSGRMGDDDFAGMMRAVHILEETDSMINDKPATTVQDIVRQARKWKHQNNIKALVIDYAQRIRSTNQHDNPRLLMLEVVPALKTLALELKIPVVLLAQAKREVDSRPDKRPGLADLAEAAIFEQEADQIITLYRDEVYNPDTEYKGVMELIYVKNRHGPTGLTRAAWRGEFLQVKDIAPDFYTQQ